MTQPDTPALTGMSIGAVLDSLRPDFPDVTISKIRFLEAEGLVTPRADGVGISAVHRLRLCSAALHPDRAARPVPAVEGHQGPAGRSARRRAAAHRIRLRRTAFGAGVGRARVGGIGAAVAPTQVRLSREDLLARSGVDDELLTALIKEGVITTGPAGFFDEHSVVIAQCARALAEYGVEPRHLRAFRSAADRQSDLIAQIAGPVVKAGKAGARDRADDLAREVAALAITLHTSLIKSAVRDVLDR